MDEVDKLIEHCQKACRSAKLIHKPFPHFVIDNFLPPETFIELSNIQFAEQVTIKKKFESSVETGKTVFSNEGMEHVANIPIKLLGGPFGSKLISDLFRTSGISSMFDRPNFGGYYPFHQMKTGGWLGPHVDHSFSTDGQIHIANCIYYANNEWQEEWGGHTILYDKNGLHEVARVDVKPNRLLLFMHSSFTFHGVALVKCPSKVKRHTYYMDYYADKEDSEIAYTYFKEKYNSKFLQTWRHGTIFIPLSYARKSKFRKTLKIENLKKELKYIIFYVIYLGKKMLTKVQSS